MTTQNRWLLGCTFVAVLLAVGPVMAAPGGWTTLKDINGYWGLVSDGTTLYAVGNDGAGGMGQVWTYSGPTTDTWTPLSTAPFTVFAQWSPGEGDWAKCIDGKIYTRQSDNMLINIYDIATDSWSQAGPPPLIDPVNDYYAYSQMQTAGNGQITISWTEFNRTTGHVPPSIADPNVPSSGRVSCNYNIATGTWGNIYETGPQPYMWMQTNQLNGVVYAIAGLSTTLTVQTYDLKTQPANFSGTWVPISHTLSSGSMTDDAGGAFGVQIIGVDNAKGKVYFAGVNNAVTIDDNLGGTYDGNGAPPPANLAGPGQELIQRWVYLPGSWFADANGNAYIWVVATQAPMKLVSYDPATGTWAELPDGIGSGTYRSMYTSDRAGKYMYFQEAGIYGNFQAVELEPILMGDTDGNGVVDVNDLNNVFNNLGTVGQGILGDTNEDGVIDVNDLNNVFNNLGTVASAGAEVPEPATLSLLALAGLGLLRRRK